MPFFVGVRSVEDINDSGYPPRDRKARTMHATDPHITAMQPETPTNPDAPTSPDTTRGFAITSFVLGIASVVSGWTFFIPVAGLVFGIIALRRQTTERTLALWGVWLNAAMLALTALAVLFFVIVISLGLFALPFAV